MPRGEVWGVSGGPPGDHRLVVRSNSGVGSGGGRVTVQRGGSGGSARGGVEGRSLVVGDLCRTSCHVAGRLHAPM